MLSTSVRLNRIKNVSKWLRLVLQYGIPLWFLFGFGMSVLVLDYKIKIPFFSRPETASPLSSGDVYWVLPLYWCLLMVLFLFWYRAVVRLFACFESGVLFSDEIVRRLQFLGGIYFIRFLVDAIFHVLIHNPEMIVSRLTDLFAGFLIFFIGWLIAEARKIQEEQELTV